MQYFQVGLGQQGRSPLASASGHTMLLEVALPSETLLRTLSGEMAMAAVTLEFKRFKIFFFPPSSTIRLDKSIRFAVISAQL